MSERGVSKPGAESSPGCAPRPVGPGPSRPDLGSEPGGPATEGRTERGDMATPFLPAGATTGDSGGELSSGDDSGDVESPQNPETEASRNLAELFEKAAAHLQSLIQVASREQLLYLYARYKQVKLGRGGCKRHRGSSCSSKN